jgi:general secretion pathway protein B
MSYILDALRRADAERERDPARGIHAQPAAGAPAHRRNHLPSWAWPALAALLVAGAAVVWLQRPAEPPPSALPARALAPVPAPVLLPVATNVSPAAPAPPAPVAAATSVSPAAPPMPAPVEKPRVALAPASVPPPVRAASAAAAKPAPPASATAAVPAATAPAAPASAAADRVYNVAELPADVQQGLPKLAISGGVYSENVSQRMLVVGGQVVNEGAEVAPGVVLEQIRARAAVLRFRGYRYSVAY